MKDLDLEDLIDYIHGKTGLDKRTIELVLNSETDYLLRNGFAVIE